MPTKIFIAYGRQEAQHASRLYHDLKSMGLDPWLDTESLIPGIKWKAAIRKAMRTSQYVLSITL